MPAALPIIGAFASGAVGAVVAGTATFAQFATVAGAVLSGVGALTGKKDLVKIGAVLGIGGAIGTSFAGAASAPGVEGAVAQSADAIAGATSVAEEAAAATSGMEGITSAGVVQDAATGVTTQIPDVSGPGSLAEVAARAAAPAQGGAAEFATKLTTPEPLSKLAEASKGVTSKDIASWWDKAAKAGKTVGTFIEKNPTLVKLTGDMLQGMYGPQAEQMDWQRSLYNRAQTNLNNPIKLTSGGKP